MSWCRRLWFGCKAAQVYEIAATELATPSVWEPGEPCQAILKAFKVRRKTFQHGLEYITHRMAHDSVRHEVLIDTVTGRTFEHTLTSSRHGHSGETWSPSCLTYKEVQWLRNELQARYNKVEARARTINGAKQRNVLLREYPAC